MVAIFSSLTLFAQNYASIKGIAKKDQLSKVILYEVKYGAINEIATSHITKDGYYGFYFEPEQEGFYIVGDEKISRNRIYVKHGDMVELNILNDTVYLSSNNTIENKKLYQWESIFHSIKDKALNFKHLFFNHKECFPILEAMRPAAEAYKQTIKTKNSHFNNLMASAVRYDMDYYAIKYLNTPKLDIKDRKPFVRLSSSQWSPYYSTITTKDKFSDNNILRMDYGAEFLDEYTTFVLIKDSVKMDFKTKFDLLPTDELKAELLIHCSKRYTKYEQLIGMQKKYAHYFTQMHHHERLGVIASQLFDCKDGGYAADFIYPDATGKMVALSDFRGKYVLVDVWATWCGPCHAEIPHLIKLEEAFHGKDIVFMGVSLDENSDLQKWKNMLVEKGLKGIQLFASGWSKIAEDYKIKGIPRFLLFDREGKIIKSNAPRPSEPELKKLIEELLEK